MSRYLEYKGSINLTTDAPRSRIDAFQDAVYLFGITQILFCILEMYILLRDQEITDESRIGLLPIYAYAVLLIIPFILTLNEMHLQKPYLIFLLILSSINIATVTIYLYFSSVIQNQHLIYDFLELPVFLGANIMVFCLVLILLLRKSTRRYAKIIQFYFSIYLIIAVRSTIKP